jgi:hypothetical protein
MQDTKQIDAKLISDDWRLWPIGEKLISLKEAKAIAQPLDQNFIDLVTEKSGGGNGIRRMIIALSDIATAAVLLPEQSKNATSQKILESYTPKVKSISDSELPRLKPLSLKRWRSAEQQVFNLLSAQGWKIEDVSKQNLGYDIEGRTPEGEDIFIDIKCIDSLGQPFTFTSNEEAVARQKGSKYQLAIVRQAGNILEIAFISDPIQKLTLTRQCRQWVWECSEYPYNPQQFPLE